MLFIIMLLTGIILIVTSVIIAIIGSLPILFVIGAVLISSYLGYCAWVKITKKKD